MHRFSLECLADHLSQLRYISEPLSTFPNDMKLNGNRNLAYDGQEHNASTSIFHYEVGDAVAEAKHSHSQLPIYKH